MDTRAAGKKSSPRKHNGQCIRGKPPEKCLTNRCAAFNYYNRQGLPCAFYKPEDCGYDGHFWERDGRVIRVQYFNKLLIVFLVVFLVLFLVLSAQSVISGTASRFFTFENISLWIGIPLVMLSPFMILSLLNRRFFGTRVCLLNEDGLFCTQRFIPWAEIQTMTFYVGSPKGCTYVVVSGQKTRVAIPHAPYHLLPAAKRYNPNMNKKLGF